MIAVEIYREGLVSFNIVNPQSIPYTYEFTTAIFPTSASREETYNAQFNPRHTLSIRTQKSLPRIVDIRRQRPIEIPGFPGVLEDGRWTARHPLVQTYLTSISKVYASVTGTTSMRTSGGEAARDVHGRVEVGHADDVGEVIGAHLSGVVSKVVLALSALEVVHNIRHPAHFALWGTTVRGRTAEVVKDVQASGCILSSKTWDCWTAETQRILQRAIYPAVKMKPLSRRRARAQMLKTQPNARALPLATRKRVMRQDNAKVPAHVGTAVRRSQRLARSADSQLQPATHTADTHTRRTARTTRVALQQSVAKPPPAARIPSPALALLELSNPARMGPLTMPHGVAVESSHFLTATASMNNADQVKSKQRKASETTDGVDELVVRPAAEEPRRTLRSVRQVTAKGRAFTAQLVAAQEKADAIKAKRMKRC